jgi:uncharacterized SAM-binding protein YcdF (DUF218 family)
MDAFNFSRIAGLVAAPSNLAILLLLLGLALQATRLRRTGSAVILAVAFSALAVAVLPVSQWLAKPLEDRFPRPAGWPDCVDGILVLSSGEQPALSGARGLPIYLENQGAIVAAVELARRYPKALLVFAGGSGAPFGPGRPAADVARQMFDGLGLDPGRIVYEQQSRNTSENLVLARQLAQPQAGETWLLVAAAMHMPRAMGIAEHIGWPMIAWPTDYRTLGPGKPAFVRFTFSRALLELDDAMHEWLGLVDYRWRGLIDSVFPAPRPVEVACK